RPNLLAILKHRLEPERLKFGADSAESRWNAAFFAEIHFAKTRQVIATQSFGSAALVPMMARVAIQRRHCTPALFLVRERCVDRRLLLQQRENDLSLPIVDGELRNVRRRLARDAAARLAHGNLR